jgi:hypothetical protein
MGRFKIKARRKENLREAKKNKGRKADKNSEGERIRKGKGRIDFKGQAKQY